MKKLLLLTLLVLSGGTILSGFAQTDSYLKNRILVEGLYLRNLGNFGEVWSTATGGYIGYSIAFPEHNLLLMRTGFISNKLRNNTEIEDASLTIIPLELGGRYYYTNSRFMPFFQFINGINILFEDTNLQGEKESKTLVKYSWQIGFGLTINLTNNLNVDVGANYQSNFYMKEAMNTGFEYAFGIGFTL